MEDFAFFSFLIEKRNPNDDWRQRMVWHRTPTGQRHKVKVKSLPKDEQYKYAPLEVRLKHHGMLPSTKRKKSTSSEPHLIKKPNRTFVLYYSANRPEGSFDKFTKGKLVMATDDSSKAFDIEKKGYSVAVAHRVPIEAFKKYWDYEQNKWVDFPENIDNEKKFELINWSNFDVYLVDFFKFKDQIDFHLSDPEETKVQNESKAIKGLTYLGNCKNEELIKDLFGSTSEFQRLIDDEFGSDEFEYKGIVVKYDDKKDIHYFYSA